MSEIEKFRREKNAAKVAKNTRILPVVGLLKQLTPDERMDVFCEFCKHCGSDDPFCSCWNDE